MTNKEIFQSAFVEAALWADTPEGYEGNSTRIGLASESAQEMRDIAGAFYDANESLIVVYPQGLTQAGYDLYFTIAGHGVGYWENNDEISQALDKAAKPYRHDKSLIEDDDGLLYWG
jgi:hypothetical protein